MPESDFFIMRDEEELLISIESALVEVNCTRREARSITQKFSYAIRFVLPAELRQNKYVLPPSLVVDKIEIDLGKIREGATEAEIGRRVARSLVDALRNTAVETLDVATFFVDKYTVLAILETGENYSDSKLSDDKAPKLVVQGSNTRLRHLATSCTTEPNRSVSMSASGEYWRRLFLVCFQQTTPKRLESVNANDTDALIREALFAAGIFVKDEEFRAMVVDRRIGLLLSAFVALRATVQRDNYAAVLDDALRASNSSIRQELRQSLQRMSSLITTPALKIQIAAIDATVGLAMERGQQSTDKVRQAEHSNLDKNAPLVPLSSVGLLLVWPILADLLKDAGLLDKGKFLDESARIIAVQVLDQFVWGEPPEDYARLRLPALVCGVPEADFAQVGLAEQSEQAQQAIFAAQNALPTLLGTPTVAGEDILFLFLRRSGNAQVFENRVKCHWAPHASDVLLSALPWPMEGIRFPWAGSVFDIIGFVENTIGSSVFRSIPLDINI